LILDKEKLNAAQRFHVMRIIFGGHLHEYDYHYVGFCQEFLKDYLENAGYTNIRRVASLNLFHDASNLVYQSVRISLNTIGEKPA